MTKEQWDCAVERFFQKLKWFRRIATKKLRQPIHIGVPPFFGLPQSSMAMLEQIRTIDKSRLGDYVGCLDDDVMDYIDEALDISVGLQDLSEKT